jgi:hypothetical protein
MYCQAIKNLNRRSHMSPSKVCTKYFWKNIFTPHVNHHQTFDCVEKICNRIRLMIFGQEVSNIDLFFFLTIVNYHRKKETFFLSFDDASGCIKIPDTVVRVFFNSFPNQNLKRKQNHLGYIGLILFSIKCLIFKFSNEVLGLCKSHSTGSPSRAVIH